MITRRLNVIAMVLDLGKGEEGFVGRPCMNYILTKKIHSQIIKKYGEYKVPTFVKLLIQ